jgi:hypothetical protein
MRLAIALLTVWAAFAQTPRLENARLETHALSGSLGAEMRRLQNAAGGPEWAGYAVPMIAGRHEMCCSYGDHCCGRCSLESRPSADVTTTDTPSPVVKLEGPGTLVVLVRLADHAIDKIQTYSIDCALDAGGLPFHWINGVSPAESLSYLASVAPDHKHAVMAIAMHADPGADAVLERLAAPSQAEKLREDVAFWLGTARGLRGVEILKQMLRDPSDRLREKIMFALSVSKEPFALAPMIDSAKNDASPHVRGQALFWLAHKAGQKETAAITRAIAEDPDTHVKKQAVFALQQLPRDEGIPLLIQVARTNANPEVRKQAMFWLGQSKDPRAVQFFEEILTK